MREYKSPPDAGERLPELLNRCILDAYQRRNKRSRDYSRKKYDPATGAPMILKATQTQIKQAKQVKANEKRLTA